MVVNEGLKKDLDTLHALGGVSEKGDLLSRINLMQLLPQRSQNADQTSELSNYYTQLINLMRQALELSKTLEGKRGVVFMGETGSGKSSTVSFLMGLKMKEENDRFGQKMVIIDNASQEPVLSGSALPKIGHALGVSTTLFSTPYQVLNNNNINNSEVQNGLSQSHMILLDCPDRSDTRGTNYEIAANFSIDYSINSLSSIDAVVQVIDYSALTVQRGKFFLEILRDLFTQFENVNHLQKRIFFIITKQGEKSEKDIRKMATDLLDKEEKAERKDTYK